jgi:hypothetical protein
MLSLQGFYQLRIFQRFLEHTHCARPPTLSRVEILPDSTLSTSQDSGLSVLRLASETPIRPALTCTARITQNDSELKRTRVQLLSLLDALHAEGIRLHSMQESPGLSRETIELILSGTQLLILPHNHVHSIRKKDITRNKDTKA